MHPSSQTLAFCRLSPHPHSYLTVTNFSEKETKQPINKAKDEFDKTFYLNLSVNVTRTSLPFIVWATIITWCWWWFQLFIRWKGKLWCKSDPFHWSWTTPQCLWPITVQYAMCLDWAGVSRSQPTNPENKPPALLLWITTNMAGAGGMWLGRKSQPTPLLLLLRWFIFFL